MIKITTEKEKEDYFNRHIKEYGAYFLVRYNKKEKELIWVTKFSGFKKDGSNWFLESPIYLQKRDITGISLEPFYDAEEKEWVTLFSHCYIKDNIAYEIDSPQCSPFLPKTFQIEYITDNGIDAAKFLLHHKNIL